MEILEGVIKTVPGLPFVFAIAALLLLKNDSEIAEAFRVFVVAWCLYQISKSLDWLFDLFYAPAPVPNPNGGRLRRWLAKLSRLRVNVVPGLGKLEGKRESAAGKLSLDGSVGLYQKAKEATETTREWKTRVSPLIGLSKTARTFIVPFFLIGIGMRAPAGEPWRPLSGLPLFAGFREDFTRAQERLEFLSDPSIPLGICLVSLILYVYLRVRHMSELYDLAATMPRNESAAERVHDLAV